MSESELSVEKRLLEGSSASSALQTELLWAPDFWWPAEFELGSSALALWAKRTLDVVASSLGLILLSPVFLLVAIAIKWDSAGPVFYNAPRLGWRGRRFTCYKFRSMVLNADDLKGDLRDQSYRDGPTFKVSSDPRVTTFGNFLRCSSLDELPQLLNVLKGDMSLVGPRPHPLDDCEQYKPEHLRRLDVVPGLTGLWQVEARQERSFQANFRLDVQYIESWSLWLDLKLLLRTIPAVLRGTGE